MLVVAWASDCSAPGNRELLASGARPLEPEADVVAAFADVVRG